MWEVIEEANKLDPELAQSTLDAAQLSLPKGNMTLIQDKNGNSYELPVCIINDPLNFESNLDFHNVELMKKGSMYKKAHEETPGQLHTNTQKVQ